MQLDTAIQVFLSAREGIVSPKTLRNNELYLRSLKEIFREREIEQITLQDLRAWRAGLFARSIKYEKNGLRKPRAGNLSRYTIRGMVENCRQFFNWLVKEGILDTSPAQRLELPDLPAEPPRAMKDADLEKLIAAARAEHSDYRRARNVAMVLFLRDTGCRIGGASTLRWEHLDLARRCALVKEKGRGGGKTRVVFFKEEAAAALQEWLALHPAKKGRRTIREQGMPENACEFVFVSERYPYAPLSPESIYCVFKALKEKAGVKGQVNPHSLRHRRAKTMLQNGAPLGLVSRVLGHSDVRVTDKSYGVYADQELKDGFDKYA